jgi:hypothetical protein
MEISSKNALIKSITNIKATSPFASTILSSVVLYQSYANNIEELNHPFVIHDDFKQRKFSVSTHSRNISSNSIERKSKIYEEKCLKNDNKARNINNHNDIKEHQSKHY